MSQVNVIDMPAEVSFGSNEPTADYFRELKENDPEKLAQLMKKLIVIDLPIGFVWIWL